jgi:glycosyltransferase involved in cell wall biosynthesis
MKFSIPFVSDIVFFPMMRKANYVYSNADNVIAVSETYVNRALKVNKQVKQGLSVYLGTDLTIFDKYKNEYTVKHNDNIFRIAYIGTLGTSYDIKNIIDSIKLLNNKGINNIKFIVMGSGPLQEEFEEYAKRLKIECEFTGKLDYPKMVGILCSCDIAVTPIIGKSVASIINKVGDYAAAGLPVINTQNSDEYKKILEQYSAGINCENGNAVDVSKAIEELINSKDKRILYGKGNRKLAEDKFDRKKTYKEIISTIEGRL